MKEGGIALEVLNPTGAQEITALHAPRLSNLRGKTIGELSNGIWETHRTLPFIRELLQQRFPDVKIIPYTEFPVGTRGIDDDRIGEVVKERGCDAVILGNAA